MTVRTNVILLFVFFEFSWTPFVITAEPKGQTLYKYSAIGRYAAMQNLMKQIVEMDKKAQEITDSAQQDKVNSEKETAKKREQIRNDYLDKARKQIAEIEPQERKAAEDAWNEKKKKSDELLGKLNSIYKEKGEEWVAEIVKRVLGA